MAKVPKDNVERVGSWIKTVEAADLDKNGKLEGEELNLLNKEDRDLYDLVGEMLG